MSREQKTVACHQSKTTKGAEVEVGTVYFIGRKSRIFDNAGANDSKFDGENTVRAARRAFLRVEKSYDMVYILFI
jgi:hypothetical protein